MADATFILHIKVKLSLWSAIKLRIAGIHSRQSTIEQVGAYTKITIGGEDE
jgi:hypothetical protein